MSPDSEPPNTLDMDTAIPSPEELVERAQALIRNLRRLDLYSRKPAKVKILGNSLFRVSLHFPTNVPVGEYKVRILLVSDKDVVSTGTTRLDVGKSGIEASVYDFAHKHSALYGIVALIIAVVAGWGAAAIFRKA